MKRRLSSGNLGARVPGMGGAWTRGQGSLTVGDGGLGLAGVTPLRGLRILAIGLLCAAGALLFASPSAHAASCPQIKNKPQQIPHVSYPGVQHLTYCYGPIQIQPGQNIIRFNSTKLFPQVPGYITRFDPEFVYANGTIPRVDVLHLHHAVWVVNGSPQYAAGEEKSIVQMPQGFGWRSTPQDNWIVNDMLHDLVGKPAQVYLVWRVDFVPDTSPAAATMKTVRTKWMSVAGPSPRVGISSPIYPVFNALRGMGENGRYTFPDQAVGAQRNLIDTNSQSWTPDHPVTLVGAVGHLHPGGLDDNLVVKRGNQRRSLFRSNAHYYEPAGAVSWDVAMGATPPDWRVQLQAGDQLSVHTTYNTKRASWYEVMGIMPVAVYNGTGVGGVGPFSKSLDRTGVLTHGHLDENRNHGGAPTYLPDPRKLQGIAPSNPIGITDYRYQQGDLAGIGNAKKLPRVHAGQSLTFKNNDANTQPYTFHSITDCEAPCNRSTGIAYPIADGPKSFDSGQLGFNRPPYSLGNAPAVGTDTWKTPKNLKPGTYTYFCRVHPFMRGAFRVVK
jgi:plastocyanin